MGLHATIQLKGTVHPKIILIMSFTHLYVIPDLILRILFSTLNTRLVRKFMLLFPDMKVNGVQAGVKFLKGQKAF